MSGLGSVSVIGRMRAPNPAANTMAVLGTGRLIRPQRSVFRVGIDRRWAESPRQVILIPDRKRPKQRMSEVTRKIALDPRQVAQVLGLVITFVEASEKPQDLCAALGAHCGIGDGELLRIKAGISGRSAPHVEGGEAHLEILG